MLISSAHENSVNHRGGGRSAGNHGIRGTREAEADIPLGELGFEGHVRGHDVWKKEDLGVLPDTLRLRIPAHAVVLLRVSQAPGPAPSH